MKIAVAQIDCELGNVPHNCKTIVKMIERAGDENADMVVLPEMSDTGFHIDTINRCASSWSEENSPFRQVCQAAKKSNVSVVCGLSRRDHNGSVYNSAVVVNQYGDYVGHYDKTHLFDFSSTQESAIISAGDHFFLTNMGEITFGFLICYDLRFPEAARSLALQGAEVIVIIAAFPFPRQEHWTTLTRCRAIENQAYVIAVNRVGTDGDLTFCGTSSIIDPIGACSHPMSSCNSEELFCGIIDSQEVSSIRQSMGVFGQRRIDLYYKGVKI